LTFSVLFCILLEIEKGERVMYIELMNKNEVTLAKHSAVIQMSNKMSAIQRKCYNAFLYTAKKQLEENPGRFEFEIDAKILLDFFKVGENYTYLKEKLEELQDIKVKYNILEKDKKQSWGVFNLIAGIEYENSKFIFSFPHQVLKSLVNPNIYTYIDLVIIKDLKSKYSIALYELLKDYKEIKEVIIEVSEFRELMGVKEKQYTMFSTFRDKVINRAISEINKSEKIDFKVEYELKKSGKKYSHIKFLIKKKTKKAKNIQIEQAKDVVNNQKVELLLQDVPEDYKLPVRKLLNKELNKYPLEYLQYQVKYANKQENIKNYTAYLQKAIKEDYADCKNRLKFEKKAQEERKRLQEEEKALKMRIMDLQRQIKLIEDEAEKEFFSLPEEKQKELIKKHEGIIKNKKIAKMAAIGEIINKKIQENLTAEDIEFLENHKNINQI